MLENNYVSDVYMPVPCKGCTLETGRYPGCHANCDKYISYRKAMDEKKEKLRKIKEEMYNSTSVRHEKRMKGAKHGEV